MKRLFLLALVIASALSAQTTFTSFVPHLADGGSWRTIFSIVNLSDNNPGSGTLRFHAEDGSALSLQLTTGVTTSQVAIALPPNGSTVVETAGAGGNLIQGWVELNDQSVPSALFVTAIFRESLPNYPQFEASVPAVPVATKALSFAYDNTPGYASGIAMTNSSSLFTGKVGVTVRDEAGLILATDTITLTPGAHSSFAVGQYAASGQRRGIITLTPDSLVGLNALGFRFNPTGPFTTLSPVIR